MAVTDEGRLRHAALTWTVLTIQQNEHTLLTYGFALVLCGMSRSEMKISEIDYEIINLSKPNGHCMYLHV